jgi:hypothetical protein
MANPFSRFLALKNRFFCIFFYPKIQSILRQKNYNSRIQILRKLVGFPWSCNLIGPLP